MFYTLLFVGVFLLTVVGVFVYRYYDSDSYFFKKTNSIQEGMRKEQVISIMGNNFSCSKDENGLETLEWRKVRNGKMIDNGTIKGRPTLFGYKAKTTTNTTIQNGYTISFKVNFKDNIVVSFSTEMY